MSERHVLVVFPHPDDESFGVAGSLAKYIAEGATVTYACLTLGEMGRNMGFPPFTNRVSLPKIRKQELLDSCEAIGIQDLRMLGFHDKTIEFEDPEVLDGRIAAIIDEIKPSLVITFYPGYAVHPDHDACGAAVIRVVGRLPEKERPVVHCVAFSNNHEQHIGKADVTVDISDYLEYKLASIRSHRSQFQAAELLGNKQLSERELKKRFGREAFWTYSF